MGRIYEERGAREELRWYCSFFGILAKPSDVRTDGRAPTLEAAKADFEASWRKWLEWAKLGEARHRAAPLMVRASLSAIVCPWARFPHCPRSIEQCPRTTQSRPAR